MPASGPAPLPAGGGAAGVAPAGAASAAAGWGSGAMAAGSSAPGGTGPGLSIADSNDDPSVTMRLIIRPHLVIRRACTAPVSTGGG